jgi:hypothetical protein
VAQLSLKSAYLCHLEGGGGGAATIPCTLAKRHYTVVTDCSKLYVMQNSAPNHDDERPPTTNRLTEASHDQSASRQLGEANREARRLGQRHTVKEAAEVLGTTVDAVRGRIRRGTLDSVKLDGVVYVLLDPTNREQQSDKSETEANDATQQATDQMGLVADQWELVGEMRDQIDWLRREVERKDTIIMSLTQRIPELEAPSEPRDAPETATLRSDRGSMAQEDAHEPVERRSWLYWFFFGS